MPTLRHARVQVPRASLLRMSAGERLAGATVLAVALWGVIVWAVQA
jgi:hypothetical protein